MTKMGFTLCLLNTSNFFFKFKVNLWVPVSVLVGTPESKKVFAKFNGPQSTGFPHSHKMILTSPPLNDKTNYCGFFCIIFHNMLRYVLPFYLEPANQRWSEDLSNWLRSNNNNRFQISIHLLVLLQLVPCSGRGSGDFLKFAMSTVIVKC